MPKEDTKKLNKKLQDLEIGGKINISNSKVDKFFEDNYNEPNEKIAKKAIKCTKCKGSSFADHHELKLHYKSKWHLFNIQISSRDKESLTLEEYDDHLLMNGINN